MTPRTAIVIALSVIGAILPAARAQDALLADTQGTTGDASDLLKPDAHVLPPDVTADGVTVRFVELGEFQSSRLQGLEIDLINQRSEAVRAEVTMVLSRVDPATGQLAPVARSERRDVEIPPNTRQGFRVAEPLVHGSCQVELDVKVNGAAITQQTFEFRAAGPYRLTLRPYILSRNGVLVRVDLRYPSERPEQFIFTLLDAQGRQVLWQTDEYRRFINTSPLVKEQRVNAVEALVNFDKHGPGNFFVEVEVRADTQSSPQAAAPAGTLVATVRHPALAE